MKRETGRFRELWNYFKRGKSEINFLLNIYQTLIIIWAGTQISGNFWNMVILSGVFLVILFIASLFIGKYSLTKVDTALPYIRPFAQDVTKYRILMARGNRDLAEGFDSLAKEKFAEAERILSRWLNDS